MKKIYITPSIFCVKINTRSAMLQSSITKGASNFDPESMDYVKEENSPINDVNVWDDEW